MVNDDVFYGFLVYAEDVYWAPQLPKVSATDGRGTKGKLFAPLDKITMTTTGYIYFNRDMEFSNGIDNALQGLESYKRSVIAYPMQTKGDEKRMIVDLGKLTDADRAFLVPVIQCVIQKRQIRELSEQYHEEKAKVATLERRNALLAEKFKAMKTRTSQMRDGIAQIQRASTMARAGFASRKVNALKEVIDQVSENVK